MRRSGWGILALVIAGGLQAQTDSRIGNYLETIKVNDQVYVFKPKLEWSHGNGVAIIGADGVFFVDTYIQANYAEEAIQRLRKVTRLPVRYVLNTHWHNDHVMGNGVFKAAFPGSLLIMQDSAVGGYERRIRPAVDSEGVAIAPAIAQLTKELADGKTTSGYPIVGNMRPFWEWLLRDTKAYQKEFHGLKFVEPDITFGDTLTFKWGGQTLRLIHMADNGHSAGDAVVWIPETRILIAGDLVVGPTPYATYFNTPGMVRALQHIIAMDPAIVIPGHGEIQHDLSYVKLLEQAFATYRRAAEEAVAAKVPRRTALDSLRFPEIDRQFTGDDVLKQWAFRAFFRSNLIYNTYKYLDQPAPPEG